VEGDTESLTHLEVQIEFTNDLGPVWAVNSYCINWEVGPFERPLRSILGRDHDGKREVPRNGLSCILVAVYIEVLDITQAPNASVRQTGRPTNPRPNLQEARSEWFVLLLWTQSRLLARRARPFSTAMSSYLHSDRN